MHVRRNEHLDSAWAVMLREREAIMKGFARRKVLNSMGLPAGARSPGTNCLSSPSLAPVMAIVDLSSLVLRLDLSLEEGSDML